MDDVKKKIIVGYCIAIILVMLIVPWKIDWHTETWSTKISQGYSFVLSPPNPAATIDLSKIFLEIVIITAGAGILYVMRDKIFRK
jgi:L-asparagine transporter-like permease